MIGNNGNKCLLDTSIIIHAFRENNAISAQLDALEEIFIPFFVVGELYYGAYKSANPTKHIKRMELFFNNCVLLFADRTTADYYGSTKTSLVKKGKPIPENDIWIASMAKQLNLPLFTSDKHFDEVEGLLLFGS